jgi:transposase
MDIHLDTLLGLPYATVFTCYQKAGFIILKLDLINEGINCHHCQTYTDKLHEDRPILVRDLSICGQKVYLQVPRRQFECPNCQKTSTERLSFLETRRRYTVRYEEYIYERVKELTAEQVSQNEDLSPKIVTSIFQRMASRKKRLGTT